ncbi:MAG: Eco57I restriction-modification methylase domain-containing protein, partial [Bacteroidales bacterium]|nr:Eco57I restriction-modification methylase domain-containing protein [Bacteroidales bacterium]
TIPFLNGGLFECLDFKEGNKEIRFDGFSSTEKRQAFVPDKLFFADEFVLDLNTEYGTKGKKYKVEGLINILDSYKFTIAENTPMEEEIALDPELLGKVFENLLASYNPETQTTARKQTGSFYTPREIVNYMVDESLIAYFKQKLDNSEEVETRLRDLFAHTTDLPEFSKEENTSLIKAISKAKILDPACGSGAFPMGVLHRLVDLLNKLDPENKKWNELQIQRAIDETAEVYKLEKDSEERKIRLNEIEKAFDVSINYPDYARKLFLIENCIYGVDIQQIAIQISKLRFFISLIVDQKVNDTKPNRNILSMPNLETKFVAANTLIGLDKPEQLSITNANVEILEKELASIRHKIFFTRKYSAKKALKKKEKEKRELLKKALIDSGFGEATAAQMAGWNPFDPMQSAKFFDPETMFGFDGGFDVVVGNPPYVDSETMTRDNPAFREKLKSIYSCADGNWDLFVVFTEKAFSLCRTNGCLSFIIPNKLISAKYTYKLRSLLNSKSIIELLDFSYVDVFKEADVYPVVLLVNNTKAHECNVKTKVMRSLIDVSKENVIPYNLFSSDIFWDKYFFNKNVLDVILKLSLNKRVKSIFPNILGAATVGEAYEIKSVIKELSNEKNYFKFVNTGTIDPYKSLWGIKKTQYIKGNYEKPIIRQTDLNKINPTRLNQASSAKIIIAGMSLRLECLLDVSGVFCAGKSTSIIISEKDNLKTLIAILNSKVTSFWFSKYFNSLSMAGGYFNIGNNEIGLIPLPKMSFPNLKLNEIVDKIIYAYSENSNSDTTLLEKQIDELVYKLYELTYDEVKLIDPEFTLTESEYNSIKLE